MKKDYCDITFIIDRSGSMWGMENEVIGGFNSFVDDQKKVDGTATFTLVQFDNQYEVNYVAKDIQKVEPLDGNYHPRGSTAMLDAIGKTIVTTGERLRALPESERPEKVIVLIQTDGFENASREYNSDQVKKMIEVQQNEFSWEFVFLGANIDAVSTASSIGIKAGNAMTYAATGTGTLNAIDSVSKNMTMFRSCSKSDMSYTSGDIQAQAEEGVTQ